MSAVYRFRQDRETNLPAATNQLSAPSNFRDAQIDDHALVFNETSAIGPNLVNQALFQFAHRSFDFPSVSYEPHLQIANTLDMGRHFNAINGDQEARVEIGDSLSAVVGCIPCRSAEIFLTTISTSSTIRSIRPTPCFRISTHFSEPRRFPAPSPWSSASRKGRMARARRRPPGSPGRQIFRSSIRRRIRTMRPQATRSTPRINGGWHAT